MTDQTAEAVERLTAKVAQLELNARLYPTPRASAARDRQEAADLTTLLADRERLRLALKPFATVGRLIDRYFPEHGDAETFHSGAGWRDKKGNTKTLTFGDFREARTALNTQGEGE